MNNFIKVIILAGVIFLNYMLILSIPIQKIDWNDFFPHTKSTDSPQHWFEQNTQYLFIELPNTTLADKLLNDGKIINYYKLNENSNLHLFIFNFSQQNFLLNTLKEYESSGTSIIGMEVMKNFVEEISIYLVYVAPILLILLLFLTSITYWVNIILELNLFYLLLLLSISITNTPVTASSLLALNFLIIYAFTLFNYLFSGEINKKKLSFGISISIVTTALSAFFLYLSQFGLIHSFGKMMLFGLVVLLFYTLIRIYFTKGFHLHLKWFDKISQNKAILFHISFPAIIVLSAIIALNYKNFLMDLNPLNLVSKSSPTIERIKAFEKKHLPSLPFVIEITTKEKDFSHLESAKELNSLIHSFDGNIEGVVLSDVNKIYTMFSEQNLSSASTESYAQFLLALEMSDESVPIFSDDFTQSFVTMLLPINSSSNSISTILKELKTLEKNYPNFSINVLGKLADMNRFSYIFFKEFAIGLALSIGFIFIFFLFYCKSYRAVVILFSTIFSIAILLSIHLLFSLNMTLMTLISVILFVGLIADSMIHIFICYKDNKHNCFSSITKPIILSNISMITGLIGMIFSGSLMREFGMELSILLSANLVFILYIMPPMFELKIFKKHISLNDSYETEKS